MAKFEIIIDASILVKAYQQGFEDAFMMMNDFEDLEKTLNENKIDNEDEC